MVGPHNMAAQLRAFQFNHINDRDVTVYLAQLSLISSGIKRNGLCDIDTSPVDGVGPQLVGGSMP
jgi:hypothetical protein